MVQAIYHRVVSYMHKTYVCCFLSLQLYFQKIAELTMSKSSPALFKKALVSLASDSGLHPLVPYFTNFIADEVTYCTTEDHAIT